MSCEPEQPVLRALYFSTMRHMRSGCGCSGMPSYMTFVAALSSGPYVR